jgi:TonB-linked SusC/RagA family outer membrane protein
MRTRKSKKFLSMLVAGFLFCYPGNYVSAKGDASDEQLAVQQTKKTVTGTVLDIQGEPMIGVSVIVQETKEGAVTDVNGRYSIFVQNDRQTLLFSYIGYKSVTVVANKEQVNVTMEEDAKALGEVVVVGYGMQKKENLTGAVSSVDVAKTLEGRAIPDAGRGLQGTTPGLSIILPSGEVGSDPTIRIRGQIGSYQGSSSPLILLDNVEIPSLALINPDDIESISVLKDAASASIYGAKGAFGVVLITSKKGAKIDGTHVSYSGNFSWQNASKRYEMGGVEAMEYTLRAAQNANSTMPVGAFYKVDEQQLAAAKEWQKNYGGKLGPNDPTVYGRDWYSDGTYKYGLRTYDPYEYLIKEWAPTQDHKASINGRRGNTTYNVGLNYLDQSGMNKAAKKDRFTRYTGTIRVNSELNNYVSVNAGAMYSTRQKDFPYQTRGNIDPWYYLYRWGPQYPLGVDERGEPIRSPYSEFQQANTASKKWNYTSFNIGSVLTLTKDWTVNFDYTHTNTEWREFWPGTKYTAANSWTAPVIRNDANGNPIYVNSKGEVVPAGTKDAYRAYDLDVNMYTGPAAYPNDIRTNTSNSRQNTINAYSTYNLKLNDDNVFKFMLGLNRVTYEWVSEYSQKDQLTNIENPQFNFTEGDQWAGGDFGWQAQLGYYGRINYTFKDRYLLEGNLRYDGSSKFPTTLQWRWFPSVSAGWRASEEAFMTWAQPALSSLKFRGSFGIIGDQTVPGSLYIPTMGSGQISWLDPSGNRINYVGVPSAIASDITWQDIQTTDIGVDVRLFNSDLGFTFDWYRRDTKNMIVPNETSTYTYGTTAPLGNYGNLRTDGWEFSIDFNHRFANGIGVNGMVTISDAITTITEYGKGRITGNWYNGKTYGEIWGYHTDRLYQLDDFELDASGNLQLITLDASAGPLNAGKKAYKLKGENPVYQAYLQSGNFYFGPGDVKFKDLDGDGQISTGDDTVENPGDRRVIGNTTPRYEYGFRLGADYKGFDFSVFFQGVGKRNLWGSSSLTLAGYNPADGAIAKTLCTNYWTKENTDAFYPRPWPQANSNDAFNMRPQDRYLLNMAYLRLKNMTLGYTVPATLLKKYWIQKARIYVSAENLYTWDRLNGLPVDPEIIPGISMFATNAAGDNYQAGRAGLGIPSFKNVSVGIQLNF